ncbi:hypothetical protein LJC37_04575 [Bacteroidales bacterium OttesenSCG-928-E04]|nr:hypothetical protein [Bacteroidales bacterium OttesenSCG-928-E04]
MGREGREPVLDFCLCVGRGDLALALHAVSSCGGTSTPKAIDRGKGGRKKRALANDRGEDVRWGGMGVCLEVWGLGVRGFVRSWYSVGIGKVRGKFGSLEVWEFGGLEVWRFGGLEVWR